MGQAICLVQMKKNNRYKIFNIDLSVYVRSFVVSAQSYIFNFSDFFLLYTSIQCLVHANFNVYR